MAGVGGNVAGVGVMCQGWGNVAGVGVMWREWGVMWRGWE